MMLLARKVTKMTKEGSLVWKETERDDTFQVSFANSSLRLAKRQSAINSFQDEFYISVLNSEGSVVDEIGDEDVDESGVNTDLYQVLKECYEIARRQSLGIDMVIDEIMGELDDIDPGF